MKQTNTSDRTHINNINYNNYDNNNITTNNDNIKVCETDINLTSSFLLTSQGEVKGSKESSDINLCAEQLPDKIKFIKAELFDNSTKVNKQKLKVSIAICKNGKIQKINSALNSPFRHIKRGLESDVWNHSVHYELVRAVYADLKRLNANPRASKCYMVNQKQQGQHIQDVSVVLAQEEDNSYLCILIYKHHKIMIQLKGGSCLTARQKQVGIIGTGTVQNSVEKKGISIDELF